MATPMKLDDFLESQSAAADTGFTAVLEAISPASAADIHVCPLPKEGPLL